MMYNYNMNSICVKVYAKLNLNLYVGQTTQGYHNLDSFFTSVDVYDFVEVTARTDSQVCVSGTDNIALQDNTAYKAAKLFVQSYKTKGCDIHIDKAIPMMSGMGGSSADAAGALVALAKLYNIDTNSQRFANICAKSGSDVSFMVRGGLARLTDRGTQLQYFNNYTRNMYFVVTTFDVHLNTADVFALWDSCGVHNSHNDNVLTDIILSNDTIDSALLHNDLQSVVQTKYNYAQRYLDVCRKIGVNTVMTGSGSAYFVLCHTNEEAQRVCKQLQQERFCSMVAKRVNCGVQYC